MIKNILTKRSINIAQISRSDASGGGAGRSAEKITFLLNTQQNINTHHWVGYLSNRPHPYVHCLHGGKGGQLLYRFCKILSRKVGLPDFLTPEIFTFLWQNKLEYDLYHIHDTPVTISPFTINWLAKRAPVVWTLRDCSPFTGGCLYPLECKAYINGCQNCPQLEYWPLLTKIDRTSFLQNYKLKMARANNITGVAPSSWIANKSIDARMFNTPPTVIPNAVDQEIFTPTNQANIRNKLGIKKDEFLILITSMDLENRYKGTTFGLEAIKRLQKNVSVLLVGKVNNLEEVKKHIPGVDLFSSGYVKDDSLLAQYYSSADVFLFPTLADNLPNVVIETMSCGTPTIGFATGGVPELVQSDVNGWLSKPKDIERLVTGLEIAINEPERLATWRSNGLQRVKNEFSHKRLLEDHLQLYDRILSLQEN